MIDIDPATEQAMREKVTEKSAVPEGAQPASPRPKPSPPRKPRNQHEDPGDPDKFLRTAKETVVSNYNAHRDTERSPELSVEGVVIVWFSKTLGNWKAILSSPIVRGLLWEVTFNGHKNELYVDVYKKLNNVKVSGATA